MKALPKSFAFLFPFLIISLLIFPQDVKAQIQTYWIDTSSHSQENHSIFFTNRPVKINSKTGTWGFKNKSTKQTDNLFFCLYDYDHDSILIKYRAQNTSDAYPVEKVENNIFYKVYDDLRIKKGINKISIIVPGYSHTFKDQVNTFMRRVKMFYGDSTSLNASFILYAWGDEWRPYRY